MSRKGEREDDKFRSPEFAFAAIDQWANAHGRALRRYEAEIDVSGSKARRPILETIIEAIERGELGGIVVAKLDRLSRLRPLDRIMLFERIERAGGVILSASENLDVSTPEGRFARDVFLSVARMQWEQKAEGFATAKREAVKRGAYIANQAPYGYRFGPGHVLEPVAEEAAVVVELFELRAAGGSRGDVLELFERRTGRSSSRQTIAGMLANRAYLGEVHYGTGEEDGFGRPGEVLANLEAHDAIVEAELFERVQRVERERSSGAGSGGKAKALLAGIATCASCGRGLRRTRTGSRRAYSYKCPSDARKCSARAHIGAELLDAYVTGLVLAWAGAQADELVELELELGASTPWIVLEHKLAEARELVVAYEADAERELEVGAEAFAAGRKARVALVQRLEGELKAAGQETELELARTTLRAELAREIDVDARRRLFAIVLDGVVVRRTPARGASAAERVRVTFRGGGASPETLGEDAAELVAELLADAAA